MTRINRTLTELFYEYKNTQTIPAALYDRVIEARKRRPEILAFCQRVFLRLRRSIYGEAVPTYGGDLKQLAKKRRMDVVPPVQPKEPENTVTVLSMFQEEASETPAKDITHPESETDKDPEPMDLTQDKEPLQSNNE